MLVRELARGSGCRVTTRNDEAALVLHDVLGMGLEQFTKVVLLPQGDFAASCGPTPSTRRALLERLFDTDRFTAVEQWLRESAAALRARVDAAGAVTGGCGREPQQAALPAGRAARFRAGRRRGHGAGRGRYTDAAAEVTRLRSEVAAALEEARARRVAAQERSRRAAAEHRAAQRTAELQARHRELTAAAERLRRGARDHRERRARLSAARRAAGLERWLEPLEAARARSVAALARVDAAVVELVACGPLRSGEPARATFTTGAPAAAQELTLFDLEPLGDAELDDVELEVQAEAAQRLVGELAALEQESREAPGVAAAVAAARAQLAAADAEVDAAGEAAEHARAQARAAVADLTAAREAAAGEEAAAQAVEAARGRVAATERAAVLDTESGRLTRQLEVLRRRRDDARELWLDVRERRLRGMASELAAALEDGLPCPVCGSAAHPAPATGSGAGEAAGAAPGEAVGDAAGEAVGSEAAEEAARAAAEAAADELHAAEAELAGLRARLEAVRAGAAGLGLDDARTHLAAAEAALAGVRTAMATALRAARAKDRAERAVEAAEARRDRAAAARHEAATEVARLEERLDALRRRLDAGRGEYAAVADRLAHAGRRGAAAAGLLEARRELRRATEHLAEVTGAARAAASDAGFADLEAACAAALQERDLEALERACAAVEQEDRAVREALADETLLAAAAAPPADPVALETVWQLAQADDDAAAAALDRCDTADRALAAIEAELAAHVETTEPLLRRYRLEADLARCLDGTGGDNALRMSLSSYVLAARLEQVAAAASERLLVMSGGRYTLVHCDDAERGRGRSGLALRVVDSWTGRRRDTASLSGGESFYTSLALALGLADVVTAEAGGAAVETLFVDEGFGSLDDDTLTEVMDVLDGLRSGGRVVGLVSHVPDLRDRIPARLEVVRTRSGSTLRQAVA